MPREPGEKFHAFISHKHDDHALAMTVKKVLEGLTGRIECFVSGADLSAGSDWNVQIRSELLNSHLLILLFTEPSRNWDWCLYEAGLFTSLGVAEDHSVVCLYRPESTSPRPLSNLQGVPARPEAVQRFLYELCKETWRIADEWRLGALVPRIQHATIQQAAAEIVAAFPEGDLEDVTYYPCHRLVLDLGVVEHVGEGIPDNALVIEGEGGTSNYTLSLFNLASGRRTRTWGELVAAAGGADSPWRADLDQRFVAALNEQLFSPTATTMPLLDPWRKHKRSYRPILYQVIREGSRRHSAGSVPVPGGRPLKITIVLDPVPGTDQGPATTGGGQRFAEPPPE
jgi:hypothetical protein